MDFDIESRTILKVRHGSMAYGTNIEGSDVDIKGVCVPPLAYYLGAFKRFEQHVQKHPNDSVIFGLQKFIKLAADCNPNIIEILFVDEQDVLFVNDYGRQLLASRNLFLSRKAKHTFSGYAHSQLKRIKTHRSWLLKPPPAAPKREAFGLPPERTVSKSEMGAFLEAENKGYLEGNTVGKVEASVLRLLTKEKAYGQARREWEQYQEWVRSRNPARAELEAKFGYDCKHAGHLVRLMRMCKEILSTGKVLVRRPDAEELRSIRAGAWSYEKLIDYAESLDEECGKLYNTSVLPHSVNQAEIDELTIRITHNYLAWRP